jgi:hypothetical protein
MVVIIEELAGPSVSTLGVVAEAKQSWSNIGWVTKNLLSRVPSCFGRHVKAAFAVVSIYQSAWWAMARSPCG